MATRQIVVARYNEDVSWAEGLPAIIYNKGTPLFTSAVQRHLPNVGRESHTYLHHITTYWDQLADMTLFTQGRIDDHLPTGFNIEQLFKENADVLIPRVMRRRDWGPDGRLDLPPGPHRDALAAGRMKPAALSMADWYRKHLYLDLDGLDALIFVPGAVFSASRKCIQRRPRAFYANLLSTLSGHPDPEEGHYMERAWLYVLGMGIAEVQVPAQRPPG
jgi:hypothetical protein